MCGGGSGVKWSGVGCAIRVRIKELWTTGVVDFVFCVIILYSLSLSLSLFLFFLFFLYLSLFLLFCLSLIYRHFTCSRFSLHGFFSLSIVIMNPCLIIYKYFTLSLIIFHNLTFHLYSTIYSSYSAPIQYYLLLYYHSIYSSYSAPI